MSIDIGRAFQFSFEDKDWVAKFAITIVLAIIPIVGWFILSGYMLRVSRNIILGTETLPEYDDWGGDFTRGLVALIGGIFYYLPIIVVSFCTSIVFGDNFAVQCLVTLLYIGYGLVMLPVITSALARFAVTGDFSVFLDFGGRFTDFTTHIGEALNLWIMYLIAGVAISILTGIGLVLCVIPGLIAMAAGYFAQAHIVGQWGRIIGIYR